MTADELPAAFASMPAAWAEVLPHWQGAAAEGVIDRIRKVSAGRPIGPADPFRALRMVTPERVRVVLLGQDPYPTPGHADGLAFSSAGGRPASLRRIFQILSADRPGFQAPAHARLDAWAAQGVLLLNTVLTVELGRIGSHLGCGWQTFTADVLRVLLRRQDPPCCLLWGARAQAFFDDVMACLDLPAAPWTLRTRHPSNDFGRSFMAQGSHFAATAAVVDWWRLEDATPARLASVTREARG